MLATTGLLLAGLVALPESRATPFAFGLWVGPDPAVQGQIVTITAYVNASVGIVNAAEFHIDDPNPTPGTGAPMSPQDGSFDEMGEKAYGFTDTAPLSVGNHTVCVLVQEISGNNSTAWSSCTSGSQRSFQVLAPGGNQPPVAAAGGPYSGQVGVEVQFNGTGSYDPDGSLTSYYWRFGDGSTTQGYYPDPQHAYASAGIYFVILEVRDNGALEAVDTTFAMIDVSGGISPVADAGGPYSGTAGVPVLFSGNGSYDPDGTIVEYAWTFGDGNATEYGVYVYHTYTPPSGNATYTACLTVTDNDGLTDVDCTSVVIGTGGGPTNDPPVADAGPDQTGEVNEVLTFDGSGSYDTDGTIVEHRWTFSDGVVEYGAVVTHAFTTPTDPGNNVSHYACLRVTDDDGAEGFDCANVLVIDPAPGAPQMLAAHLASPADVLVRWLVSPDDGGGQNDVVAYEIYSGTSFSGNGAGYAVLATLPAGATEFLHVGAGAGDASSHFYLLRAVDALGHATAAVDQAGKFARSLTAGEQLVSVPLEVDDWSVGSVFQTVAWTRARTYVNPAGQGKNWLSNDKQKPWADLTTLSRTMAVWVKLSAGGIWAVAGLVPASTQVSLQVGWNFIGYASFAPQTVGQFLAGVSYQTVEGYAPNPPHNLQRLTAASVLSAGNGYWVHVSVGAILILGN